MKKLSKKMVVRITVSLVILAVGSYALVTYQNASREQAAFAQTMARTAEGLTVERSGLKEVLTASGAIQLKDETQVASTGSGKVAEIYVSASDFVQVGQAIVRYDIEDTKENLERQLLEAEINLANQQLNLRSLTLPATESEIKSLNNKVTTAERSITSAEKNITNAERTIGDRQRAISTAEDTYASTLEKIEQQKATIGRLEKDIEDNAKLLAVGAVTEEAYRKLVLDHENAQITLTDHEKTLQNNLNSIEEAKRNATYAEEERISAERDLEYAKRDLNDALLELENSPKVLTEENERINYEKQLNQIKLNELSIATIKKDLEALVEEGVSSARGTVSVVNTEKYASVQQGTTLITVADYTDLILAVDISEYDALKLAVGQKVEMYSDAMQDVIYEGEIVKIDPSAVTKSTSGGTETVLPIEIAIKNPGTVIRPGYTLDADITLVNKENIINIPISAIQRDQETREQFVFVVDANDVLHKTTVQLGLYGDLNVEITSGLSDGDRIVLSPTPMMTEGMSIIVGVPDRAAMRGQGATGGSFGGGFGGGAPAGRRMP